MHLQGDRSRRWRLARLTFGLVAAGGLVGCQTTKLSEEDLVYNAGVDAWPRYAAVETPKAMFCAPNGSCHWSFRASDTNAAAASARKACEAKNGSCFQFAADNALSGWASAKADQVRRTNEANAAKKSSGGWDFDAFAMGAIAFLGGIAGAAPMMPSGGGGQTRAANNSEFCQYALRAIQQCRADAARQAQTTFFNQCASVHQNGYNARCR